MSSDFTVSRPDDYDFVPKGSASFAVAKAGTPRDYLFVLLPKLTMLALSCAIEPLRLANQVTGQRLYRWYTATPDGLPVQCSNGVRITPDIALPDDPKTAYTFICSGVEPATVSNPTCLNWIRKQHRFGKPIGGICTGAFQLARAGILGGRRFTLHWDNQVSFNEMYPELHPSQNLFEQDQQLYTCGGGTAATDMMLKIIETDHGNDLAVVVADMCIHRRIKSEKPVQTSAIAAVIGSRNKYLLSAIAQMQAHIEEPLELETIARQAGCSKRQLERLFKKYTLMTPNQYYIDMRLNSAHALLSETDMSIAEVSAACGFSHALMSRRFRQKFNVSPHEFKNSWHAEEPGKA